MEWLTGLAYGIGGFVLVTGVILVVLTKFATSVGAGDANNAITYGIQQLGQSGMLGWLGAKQTMAHSREISSKKSELRLKALKQGQDRGVKLIKNYARTTDKDYLTFFYEDESKIYSLNTCYI